MAAPLSDQEFATRLDRLGPFEAAPQLAVGVSGGADSLALTLLAARWAKARGGQVTGLTVDHGLRANAAEEAATVGRWLTTYGIEHRVLPWLGAKPKAGIQAEARAARQHLLQAYCLQHGILHLLLAHQAEDQAETVLMRVVAESGPDGMAGMAAVVELADARILRPVLDVPHERLVATLRAAGQEWVEDPSNRDPRFARTTVRGVTSRPEEALRAAGAWGRERAAREAQTAAFLARHGAVHPEGWAEIDLAALVAAPEPMVRRALMRTVMTIAGMNYPPRGERVQRLVEAVMAGKLAAGRTLGGCRVMATARSLRIVREAAAIGADVAVTGSGSYVWDERFVLRIGGRAGPVPLRLSALGEAGWAMVLADDKSLKSFAIPGAARAALPALWDLDGIVNVYHLLYRRKGADPDSVGVVSAVFRPRHSLAGAGFAAFEPSPHPWGKPKATVAE